MYHTVTDLDNERFFVFVFLCEGDIIRWGKIGICIGKQNCHFIMGFHHYSCNDKHLVKVRGHV